MVVGVEQTFLYATPSLLDSEYKCLLYHTEVRWLPKGNVLRRIIQLKEEVVSFLETSKVADEWLFDELYANIRGLKVRLQSL